MKEELLAQSEEVKKCAKWVNKRIKDKQKEYSYSSDYYGQTKAVIDEMIQIKVGLEKRSRLLKHMANELI
ncbi:hypothetical protein M5X17_27660 [Paenibacillus alvei]|uniref:hypothetical protein n=1 Tax=Paenibacillus alvei TaxID=44250 RepID=UPI002281AE27|nr:hypothetical protein [Paenibacillus alvei]MCY9737483.1 hypothetical protein [Paenibacillus alvei]